MPKTPIAAAVLLAALAIPPDVGAQWGSGAGSAPEPRRGALFGTIADRAGPWSDAEVILLSRPLPSEERVGSADRIVARTDASGEFRARVIGGRRYSVWAKRARPDGAVSITRVREDVHAGMAVVLEPEGLPRRSLRVRVTGRSAWAARAPLRCHVAAPTDNVETAWLELDENGEAVLPLLPGDYADVRVLGAGGFPLAHERVPATHAHADPTLTIALDPPRLLRVAVWDARTGRGIAGATVVRNCVNRFVPLGQTGADGTAEIEIPWPPWAHRGPVLSGDTVFVVSEGYAVAALGRHPAPPAQTARQAGFDADLGAALEPAPARRGRWLLAPGRPAAGLPIVSFYSVRMLESQAAFVHCTETDAAGRFTLPGSQSAPLICLVLSPQIARELPRAWSNGVSSFVLGAVDAAKADADGDLGDLVLQSLLRSVAIRVSQPGGAPAEHARFVLVPEQQMPDRLKCFQLACDRLGRAKVLVGDVPVPIYAHTADASRLVDLVVDRSAPWGAVLEVELALRRRIALAGHVVDSRGRPVEGASLRAAPNGDTPEANEPGRTPARFVEVSQASRIHDLLQRSGRSTTWGTESGPSGAFACVIDDFAVSFALRIGDKLLTVRPRAERHDALRIVIDDR